MATSPVCRTIRVIAFRGNRTGLFAGAFLRGLDDQKKGRGPGPTTLDCLLYAGHTGVSLDSGKTIYGFNPDGSNLLLWDLLNRLRNGEAFPGVVCDDTSVFDAAGSKRLSVLSFDVILPEPKFQVVQGRLDRERNQSQYTYGFPNGSGDCNCTTWLERMGLPLLTGRMDEFTSLPGIVSYPSRKFGDCV